MTTSSTSSATGTAPVSVKPSSSQDRGKGSLAAFRGLLPFLLPYRRQFLMAGLALIVAAASTLAIPYAFKQMIDLGFGRTGGVHSANQVDTIFLAMFGVATVLALATAARFFTV
ncbi:MAG: ABC transporter, partial [Gammaproteobacteria bacterium]